MQWMAEGMVMSHCPTPAGFFAIVFDRIYFNTDLFHCICMKLCIKCPLTLPSKHIMAHWWGGCNKADSSSVQLPHPQAEKRSALKSWAGGGGNIFFDHFWMCNCGKPTENLCRKHPQTTAIPDSLALIIGHYWAQIPSLSSLPIWKQTHRLIFFVSNELNWQVAHNVSSKLKENTQKIQIIQLSSSPRNLWLILDKNGMVVCVDTEIGSERVQWLGKLKLGRVQEKFDKSRSWEGFVLLHGLHMVIIFY